MQQSNYSKEQVHKIQATPQEMDAWEALRREPGLMGRLARRGKHMKRDYVGGRRSFASSNPTDIGGGGKKSGGEDRGQFETRPEVIQGRSTAAGRSGDYTGQQNQQQNQGQGGQQQPRGPSEAEIRAKIAAEEKSKKEETYKKETAERKERRAELSGEYGEYKDEYGDLRGQAEYGDTREALSGYQAGADRMAGEAGTKFGGYESQIGQMADRGGQVAGIGTQMGQMATDATDTQKLMEDRGLFAGQIEAKRKAGEKGKMANLRRSMASAGSSPEEIARAEAEASSGAQAGREDALAASMGAMGAKQSQMSQAAGMLQGQAGMYGQAQNLGLQKTGAQAGMYGQGLQAQTGLMQMGSTLAYQQQQSMHNQITQQQGLIGSQAGMTDAQMQDVVAQQNAAQQADLAERGLTATAQANAANAPRAPSQMDQMLGMAQTVAPIAMMAMSDKKAKKNVRSAKDKDLMGPKEIDGFLNDLYAYQYNYKDAGHGTGKQVGVMAQDLEKTQLGKQMVEKTPQGKQINAAKGLGLAMASQARLNQRLNSIGA